MCIRDRYISGDAVVDKAILGESCEIYGEIRSSVIGSGVIIEEGAKVTNSIIMNGAVIGKGTVIDLSLIHIYRNLHRQKNGMKQ